jgi:putative glycosyltransferase (TIGR04372 family)
MSAIEDTVGLKSKIRIELDPIFNKKNCLFFSGILINFINKFTSWNVMLPSSHFGNRSRDIFHHNLYCKKNNKIVVVLFIYNYLYYIDKFLFFTQKILNPINKKILLLYYIKKISFFIFERYENTNLTKLKNKKNQYPLNTFVFLLNIFINIEFLTSRIIKFFFLLLKVIMKIQNKNFKFSTSFDNFFHLKRISSNFFEGNGKDVIKNQDHSLRDMLSKSWYVEIPDYTFNERSYLEKKYNIQKDINFICVNFRTNKYYNDQPTTRNEKIQDIKKIIIFLKKKYQCIIRIGDNRISIYKKQKKQNFILNNSSIDDIVFLNNCTHFIGSATGPIELCSLIGKPVLCIDLQFMHNCLWVNKGSIAIAGIYNFKSKAVVNKFIKFTSKNEKETNIFRKKDIFLGKFLFKDFQPSRNRTKQFNKFLTQIYKKRKLKKLFAYFNYFINNKRTKTLKTFSNKLYYKNLTKALNLRNDSEKNEYLNQAYKISGKLLY